MGKSMRVPKRRVRNMGKSQKNIKRANDNIAKSVGADRFQLRQPAAPGAATYRIVKGRLKKSS